MQRLQRIFVRMAIIVAGIIVMFIASSSLFGMDVTKMSIFKREVRHIGFLKVHKAASTTIENMMIRFSQSRKLTAVLPKDGHHLSVKNAHPKSWKFFPIPTNHTFDILFNHVIFSAVGFRTYLPSDSVYIASVREPFQQMISAFYYIRRVFPQAYIKNISGPNPHRVYLRDPKRYDEDMTSFTHNGMARDFGYPPALNDNMALFQEYMERLGTFFDLVIVMEKFDESIILMRRLLRWSIKDIVYIKANVSKLNSSIEITDQDRQLHRQWAPLDYALYDFFLKKLENQISTQFSDFTREVKYFKQVLKRVEEFCQQKTIIQPLIIDVSEFSDQFQITDLDCVVMTTKESTLMNNLKEDRRKELIQYGEDAIYIKKKRESIIWTPALQLDV
ncbi:galactose-3-O-sulfotransferase 2-like [Patella vulgata]|uniref:galactose-3-O-sulfotransferase 2-like n=1 Tax=Patella vulgata TaxID=6465 RepID=UPI00217F781F|nr:galactose-3-O-sulfotransferase 2-like [Patella vulgata]